MGAEEAIHVLQNFNEILEVNGIVSLVLRTIGWWIIKGLASLVSGIESIVTDITGLTSFFNSDTIKELITKFNPILGVILALSIAYIAFQIFFNKKFDRGQVMVNIALALAIMLVLPNAMVKMNELTQAGVNAVYDGGIKGTADKIIDENINDIYLYDKDNFSNEKLEVNNNISESKIRSIDITEEIDRSKVNNKKVFENKVVYSSDGTAELKRINGLFKWDDEYYRWNWNFWTIFISLLATGVTLLFSAFKIGQLLIELAYTKVFLIIFAFGDIAHGQKLKHALKNICSIFCVIFSMALMLKIYLLFTSFATGKLSGLSLVIAMMIASLAVIDGPNLVEQLFGIDAGLSSGFKTIAGAYTASKLAVAGAKGLGSIAKGVTKASGDIVKGGAGVAGAINGVKGSQKVSKLDDQVKEGNKNAERPKTLNEEMNKDDFNKEASPNNEADLATLNSKFAEIEQANEGSIDDTLNNSTDNSPNKLEDEMKGEGNKDIPNPLEKEMKDNNISENNSTSKNGSGNIDDSGNKKLRESSPSTSNSTNSNNYEDKVNSHNGNSKGADLNKVVERRNLGQYAKDRVNESSIGKFGSEVKRSYQIGKNTSTDIVDRIRKNRIENRNKNQKQ